MAAQLLDGVPLRTGGNVPMSVTPAKFEQKGSGSEVTCLIKLRHLLGGFEVYIINTSFLRKIPNQDMETSDVKDGLQFSLTLLPIQSPHLNCALTLLPDSFPLKLSP